MFGFKEAPYSKKEYDDLDKKASRHKRATDGATEEIQDFGNENSFLELQKMSEFQVLKNIKNNTEDYEKAQVKLREMRNQAQGEALKINEQYDQLLEKAKKAAEDLYNFQKEKLGMQEETSKTEKE